jgi:glycosyltransferase involved in cell wall biosynthesis
MRIGLISGEYPPMQGGVGDFTRTLGRTFVSAGHEVFVLTGRAGVGLDDEGIAVSASVDNWNRALPGVVRQWAAANALDVINLQYQTAAYNMAGMIHILPRLAGKTPFAVTFHDLRFPYLFPKAGPLRDRAVLALARGANAAIVTNHEDEERLIQAGGVRRLCRIPIGSSIAGDLPPHFDRTGWRDRIGVEPDDVLIGFFGFLNRSKGIEPLLDAIARLRSIDMATRLLMIGGQSGDSDPTNADYSRHIDAEIERLGLREQVLWTGYVEGVEVSAYLGCLDVCAMPFEDGASFRRSSFLAAIAHGCPIVTTRGFRPPPELVHGQNVYFVPPGDPVALAAALRMVALDDDLRGRLSAGAAALNAMFAWERIVDQTLALFSELSGKFV